jgi:hypothetical protein
MSNNVFANGRELACKAADGKSIASFPDVCLSPPSPPAGPVPVPYPNTGYASDATDGSKSVRISNKEVMLKNQSYFKKSTGDEAATKSLGMGVVTHAIQGKVYFAAWSMDVKIEGENAVRHLDVTTHNHNPGSGQTPPWPYADQAALDPGGNCAKEAAALSGVCSDPVAEDTSDSCCDVPQRQCVLVAKKNDEKHCCKKGRETTGHHVLPKQELCEVGSKGQIPLKGNERYKEQDAPCICATGHFHRSRYANGQLMEHGLFGNAYLAERTAALKAKKPWNYSTASAAGAAAVEKQTNGTCTKECIQEQLDSYHVGKVDRRRTLSVSEQKHHAPKKPRTLRANNRSP